MSFQKIKIAKKAFISSFAFDYSFQVIEGVTANLQWLRNKLKEIGARRKQIFKATPKTPTT